MPGPQGQVRSRAPRLEICIAIDGLLQEVPVEASEVYASNFANGLVTRLMMEEFVAHWKSMGAPVNATDLDIFVPDGRVDLSPFSTFNGYLAADPLAHLTDLLKDNSLQAAGMLWGWQAGSSLARLQNDDVKYRKAAWNLVKTRYSPEQIGAMTGYTLSYIVGYAKTQKARAAAGGGALSADQILLKAAADPDVVASKKLLARIQELLLLDLYATTVKSKRPAEIDTHFAFVRGYVRGITQASDEVFDFVFRAGYGIGYNDGFRAGYERGYRDGWRDGYASGYRKAWDEANEKIKQLQQALDDKSHNDWLGTALTVIDTVGPIILSLL